MATSPVRECDEALGPREWRRLAKHGYEILIAALLDQLRIPQADVVGQSLGGAVAIRTAIQHPDKVRRLVVIPTF